MDQMNIIKPIRRICPGKEIKFEIAKINPFEWIKTKDSNYVSNEIDGYISGKDKINGIFIKYESIQEIDESFIKLVPSLLEDNESALNLANILGCPFRIFIWPLNYPEGYDISLQKILSINEKGNVKRINLKELEEGIKILRGTSFEMPKNLLTANSYLECYLANKTKNPWPGDLDGVIYNKQKKLIEVLVEFKTHNIDSPTKNEFIGKYNKEDWRRFDVLFKLQNNIEKKQGYKPRLYYIVWGTKDFKNHNQIKIDRIEEDQSTSSSFMERPNFGTFSKELFNQLIS